MSRLEGDDFGVVNEQVDHRRGDCVVAEYLAQADECLLEVTIRLALSAMRRAGRTVLGARLEELIDPL